MKKFTVTEDTEVVLDGKKYLLEAGDQIVMESSDDHHFVRMFWDRYEKDSNVSPLNIVTDIIKQTYGNRIPTGKTKDGGIFFGWSNSGFRVDQNLQLSWDDDFNPPSSEAEFDIIDVSYIIKAIGSSLDEYEAELKDQRAQAEDDAFANSIHNT
jgi:hypothetical protein